jgi:hypothetical protein
LRATARGGTVSGYAAGVSGSTVTNIIGNGHTVTCRASLAANSWLGGLTRALVNGGQLTPV